MWQGAADGMVTSSTLGAEVDDRSIHALKLAVQAPKHHLESNLSQQQSSKSMIAKGSITASDKHACPEANLDNTARSSLLQSAAETRGTAKSEAGVTVDAIAAPMLVKECEEIVEMQKDRSLATSQVAKSLSLQSHQTLQYPTKLFVSQIDDDDIHKPDSSLDLMAVTDSDSADDIAVSKDMQNRSSGAYKDLRSPDLMLGHHFRDDNDCLIFESADDHNDTSLISSRDYSGSVPTLKMSPVRRLPKSGSMTLQRTSGSSHRMVSPKIERLTEEISQKSRVSRKFTPPAKNKRRSAQDAEIISCKAGLVLDKKLKASSPFSSAELKAQEQLAKTSKSPIRGLSIAGRGLKVAWQADEFAERPNVPEIVVKQTEGISPSNSKSTQSRQRKLVSPPKDQRDKSKKSMESFSNPVFEAENNDPPSISSCRTASHSEFPATTSVVMSGLSQRGAISSLERIKNFSSAQQSTMQSIGKRDSPRDSPRSARGKQGLGQMRKNLSGINRKQRVQIPDNVIASQYGSGRLHDLVSARSVAQNQDNSMHDADFSDTEGEIPAVGNAETETYRSRLSGVIPASKSSISAALSKRSSPELTLPDQQLQSKELTVFTSSSDVDRCTVKPMTLGASAAQKLTSNVLSPRLVKKRAIAETNLAQSDSPRTAEPQLKRMHTDQLIKSPTRSVNLQRATLSPETSGVGTVRQLHEDSQPSASTVCSSNAKRTRSRRDHSEVHNDDTSASTKKSSSVKSLTQHPNLEVIEKEISFVRSPKRVEDCLIGHPDASDKKQSGTGRQIESLDLHKHGTKSFQMSPTHSAQVNSSACEPAKSFVQLVPALSRTKDLCKSQDKTSKIVPVCPKTTSPVRIQRPTLTSQPASLGRLDGSLKCKTDLPQSLMPPRLLFTKYGPIPSRKHDKAEDDKAPEDCASNPSSEASCKSAAHDENNKNSDADSLTAPLLTDNVQEALKSMRDPNKGLAPSSVESKLSKIKRSLNAKRAAWRSPMKAVLKKFNRQDNAHSKCDPAALTSVQPEPLMADNTLALGAANLSSPVTSKSHRNVSQGRQIRSAPATKSGKRQFTALDCKGTSSPKSKGIPISTIARDSYLPSYYELPYRQSSEGLPERRASRKEIVNKIQSRLAQRVSQKSSEATMHIRHLAEKTPAVFKGFLSRLTPGQ